MYLATKRTFEIEHDKEGGGYKTMALIYTIQAPERTSILIAMAMEKFASVEDG